MSWHSWSEFVHMGGYALYVWGSFGVTAILIVGEILLLGVRRNNALKMARRAVQYGRVKDDEEAA